MGRSGLAAWRSRQNASVRHQSGLHGRRRLRRLRNNGDEKGKMLTALGEHGPGGGAVALRKLGPGLGARLRRGSAGNPDDFDSAGTPQAVAVLFGFDANFGAVLQALAVLPVAEPGGNMLIVADTGFSHLHAAQRAVASHDEDQVRR